MKGMFDFNPYIFTFLTFLVPITCLPFGFFVLSKNIFGGINRIFFCLSFSVGLWGLFLFVFCYLGLSNISASEAYWLNGMLHFCAMFIPAFFLHLVVYMLGINKQMKTKLIAMYMIVVSIALLSFSTLITLTLYPQYGFKFWVTPGIFYPIHLFVFSALLLYGYYLLIKGYFDSFSGKKNQILLFILATSIGFLGGANDYLLNYGIQIPILSTYSNVLVQGYVFLVGYAVLRYKFLDINIFIRKSLIWFFVAFLVGFIYFSLLRFSTLLMINDIVQPPLKFIYLAAAFGALFLHFSLGTVTLFNSPKKALNKVFSLLSFFIFVWIVGCFIQSITRDYKTALITEAIVSKFYVIIPSLFLHTFLEVLNIKNNKILVASYTFSLILLFLSFNGAFIAGVSYNFGARYCTDPGYLYFLFPISVAFNATYSLLNLLAVRKNISGYYRVQLDYLLVAGFSVVIAVCFSFLMIYKVIFTPFDEILNIVYGVVIGYAILKHRLMDITVVIRKGIIYSVLIGSFSGSYLLMLHLFSNYLGKHLSGLSFFISALLIVLFAIIFQPLRDKLQEIIDYTFYRGKYDYQKTLKELSRAAVSITNLNELITKVFDAIVHTIHIKNISIYVLDKRSGEFTLKQTVGTSDSFASSSIANDPLINKLNDKKEALISEENPDLANRMGDLKATIVFPMFAKNELVGFMSLGEKLSGEVYSSEDIDLLTTLCSQMGISIENSMLIDEALESQKRLFQADKLATVGALAAGLAHEIKNPIAAIKGFSQMIGKAIKENDTEAIKDFESVVPRQLDRINEIVEKLLYLSKPVVLKREKVKVNTLLDEVVSLVEKQAMKNKVQIIKNFSDVPVIDADPDQLSQAFLNLTLNSIQAIKTEGQVEIRSRTSGTDGVIVEFIDNGVGIQKELVGKIFDPFFTTKDQGSGLGLSVTRRIIMEHHGKISVSSEQGEGTTFTVELPFGSK